MAEERKAGGKHTAIMENREKITLSGVLDVISFDEESVVAETGMGVIVIRGESLHVSRLNLDSGDLIIEGTIDALEYTEEGAFGRDKGSLLGRIFK